MAIVCLTSKHINKLFNDIKLKVFEFLEHASTLDDMNTGNCLAWLVPTAGDVEVTWLVESVPQTPS